MFSGLYIPPGVGKSFKFMVFKFLEKAFTHAPVHHSNFQAEFYENPFLRTAERGVKNYDLLYQNSIK